MVSLGKIDGVFWGKIDGTWEKHLTASGKI